MSYTANDWAKRYRRRTDLSSRLTHLTRSTKGTDRTAALSAVDVLVKILKDGRLKASAAGYIAGGMSAVCFQDAPLVGIAQNVHYEVTELGSRTRYEPVGLSFDKRFAFGKGVRPVIYEQPEIARELFPKTEHWRIVALDLNGPGIIDWTHEREWRGPTDFLFKPADCVVLLGGGAHYREFIEKAGADLVGAVSGVVVLGAAI